MRKSRLVLAPASMLAVAALALSGCAAEEASTGSSDTGSSTSSDSGDTASGGDTFNVYALLPQGNDQPYGTTYLPPMIAKAEELGINR